jgi:radical SAM-linked protein
VSEPSAAQEGSPASGACPASDRSEVEPRSRSEKAQRLRLRFARGPEAGGVGHLDLSRIWERALGEAGIALSYSQGNRPQPRLTVGAGLARGVTSDGELLDAVLAQRIDPAVVAERLRPRLPPGLDVCDAWEVGMGLPSLPSAVRWADYELDVPTSHDGPDATAATASLMASESFPWEDTRGDKVRRYDLRPLIQEVRILQARPTEGDEERRDPTDVRSGGDLTRFCMRLRCDSRGVGRPDQVVKALGLAEPVRIHRQRLVLAEVSPARDAWRRRGRYVS